METHTVITGTFPQRFKLIDLVEDYEELKPTTNGARSCKFLDDRLII